MLLQLCKNNRTAQLRITLVAQKDLLRMPSSFWKEPGLHPVRGWLWVKALSEEITRKCAKCNRIWPAYQLEQDGCTFCTTHSYQKCKTIHARRLVDSPSLKQTFVLFMRTALPEEVGKMSKNNLISDTTLTLPHIQCCLEEMLQDLGTTDTTPHGTPAQSPSIQIWFTSSDVGRPLNDDNYDRPLHSMIGPFLRDYLSGFGEFDDDDDEMGHLHFLAQHGSRSLARDMMDSGMCLSPDPAPTPPQEHLFDTAGSTGKSFRLIPLETLINR